MRRIALFALAALVATPLVLVASEAPSGATTYTPDTTADQNDGAGVNGTSLRDALSQAGADDGPDTIVLQADATYQLDICTPDEDGNFSGDLDHVDNLGAETDGLVIEGNGATIEQTCPGQRVFENFAYGVHRFEDLTITGGDTPGFGGGVVHSNGFGFTLDTVVLTGNQADISGGGFFHTGGGTINVHDSYIYDNHAGNNGGGLYYNGTIVMDRTTVRANTAVDLGGGLRAAAGSAHLTNTTIVDNEAAGDGSAVDALSAFVESSTITGNTGSAAVFVGALESYGTVYDNTVSCDVTSTPSSEYDVEVGADTCGLDETTGVVDAPEAGLEALAANGGTGATRMPQVDSPLVDAIPEEDCDLDSDPDAVGTDRPVDGDFDTVDACDIGAVERPRLAAFSDVPTDHPFFEEIGFMAGQGVSTGYGDGTYKPSAAVTRQAMSAFMYRLAGEPEFVAPGTPTFSDVPTDHPFYDEIEWMADEEISTGYGDGTYRPADVVTRQAMSAFMYRLAGEPEFVAPGTPTFSDVPTNHPFYDEIEWMADEEISTGYEPGPTYRPSAAVSRQAMSAFMKRLALGPGVDVGG